MASNKYAGIIELNIKEMKEYLLRLIIDNKKLEENGIRANAVSLIGPAGIAKTSAVKDLEKIKLPNNETIKVVKVSMGTIEESGEFTGFPDKKYEIEYPNGEKRWLSESQMNHLGNGIPTGESKMSYAIPEWLHEGMTSDATYKVLLLDDYSRAIPQILQACMSIIDEKEYISWKLGPEWTVVLTENPSNDPNYQVNTLDAAQQSRYLSWHVRADKEIWCEWALDHGVDQRCVNFIYQYWNEVFTDKNHAINPRIVTKFFNAIRSIKDFDSPKGKAYTTINAQAVIPNEQGGNFAQIFNTFISKGLDKIPTPEKLLGYKNYDDVRKALKEAVIQQDSDGNEIYRDDIAGIFMFRLSHYLINGDKKLNQIQVDHAARLLTEKDLRSDLIYGIIDRISSNKGTYKGQNIADRLCRANPSLINKFLSND